LLESKTTLDIVTPAMLIKVVVYNNVYKENTYKERSPSHIIIVSFLDKASDGTQDLNTTHPEEPCCPIKDLTSDEHPLKSLDTSQKDILVILWLCIIDIFYLFSPMCKSLVIMDTTQIF
jgi:hypothetical protein